MNNVGKNGLGICFDKKNGSHCLVIEDKKIGHLFTIDYCNNELLFISENKNIDFSSFINSYKSVFRDVRYYFLDNVLLDYIKNNNMSLFLSDLRFIIKFFNEKGGLNNEELLVFLKDIFVNYKYFLKKTNKENYITDVKFFISNVVPEFIEQIKEKYNNSKNILNFIEYIMLIDDINFQSKIIEGLLNTSTTNLEKSFFLDVLENLDLSKLSIKKVSRLYSILSRQNANKAAVKLMEKIHNEYLSKLNNSEINKFSDYFCKDVNGINYFENKSNINIANYSQSMINYFSYLAKNRKFDCFKRFLSSIKENITDVKFDEFNLNDKLERSLIEQITRNIECKNQEDNLAKLFENKDGKYKNSIVSNLATSVFCDGISNKKSARFLMVKNKKTFEKAVTRNIKSLSLSNDRKNKILLNNKYSLNRLSRMKSFKENFLNDNVMIDFIDSNKIDNQDKNFLLNFYIDKVLMNKKKLSKIKLVAHIQKKNRLSKVKKFTNKLKKKGILNINDVKNKAISSLLRETSFNKKRKKFTKKISGLSMEKNNLNLGSI